MTSVYALVMGDAFGRLSEPVRRFHSFSGKYAFAGMVEIDAPQTMMARLLAFCVGSPLKRFSGPIRFELDAGPEQETWTRFFPSQTMRSTLLLQEGRVIEALGPARFTFALLEEQGALSMRLDGLRFLGIPCPSWMMPRIVAREHGDAGRLHFDVQAAMPLIGRVASYRGHLDLQELARQ